ncbi:MAG: 5'-fluoro-5'-deoxy-adenosine synthase [Saprospiraceae bacterium]|nr:5'-fluoro-5'-deoxy-adenosine synthase [Saprospiraceae bacterium]
MQFVTLTTDFGTQDFYTGALKGALLSRAPEIRLVDISHNIKPFDIVQGAFVVQNIWREFPAGTIHLIGVNCVYQPGFRFVATRQEGHFFLAPDNGLLTLLFQNIDPANLRTLSADASKHFTVKTVFAEATAYLASGKPFEELGEFAAPLLERISIQPVITPAQIRGTVIHVDNFENAVVNIRREVFEKAQNGRDFSLFFKRNDPITKLSGNYCDVAPGEPLCLFNMAGFLEIAVNMGKAATLLGLKVEDVVEVVFE